MQLPASGATKLRRLFLAVLVIAPCIGCDRVTKDMAVEHLTGRTPISLLADTIRVQYVENEGAFLGLGSVLSPTARFWLLTVGTGGLLVGLTVLLIARWDMNRRSFVALALILAGGIGNLIDRVSEGFVVDFLNVGVGWLRTGVFNVADVAITGGVIWILLEGLFEKKDEEPEPEAPAAAP